MRSLAPVLLLVVACNSTVHLGDRPNVAPAALINAPADGAAFTTGDLVSFLGTVTDTDGADDSVSVVWTSTRDGKLANVQTAWPDEGGITRVNVVLSAGVHGITLRVVDQARAIGEASLDVAVGDAEQVPSATVDVPEPFAEVLPGDGVALSGAVFDLQQPSDDLDVSVGDHRPRGRADRGPAAGIRAGPGDVDRDRPRELHRRADRHRQRRLPGTVGRRADPGRGPDRRRRRRGRVQRRLGLRRPRVRRSTRGRTRPAVT